MTVRIISLFILSAIGVTSLTACKKNNDAISAEQLLTQGNWFVHYFYDGSDETNAFSQYVFTFTQDGNVSVTATGVLLHGSWQIIHNNGAGVLTIQIITGTVISKLNDAWKITGNSGDLIEMENSGTAPTYQLHFKKT